MLSEVKIKYSVDSSELKDATADFDKLTQKEKAASAALDQFQNNLKDTGGAAKGGLAPVADGLEKANNSMVKFGAAISKNQSQLRQFTTTLRDAGVAADKAGKQAAAGFAGAESQARRAQAAAQAFQRTLAQTKPPPAMAGGRAGGGQDLIGQLMGMAKLGSQIFVAKQVYDTVIAMTKMAASVESLNAQFKFLAGSQAAAEEQLRSMKSLTNNLGINFESASKAYKDFASASTLAGQSMSATNAQFEGVLMASKALGLSGEQTSNALRAMQQALSKGTLSAEELRGQLSEAIPGAFTMTAEAVGVTEAELNKMIATGDVLSKDVLPLLALQMKQTFGPQMVEMADSLGASYERFVNNMVANAKSGSSAIGGLLKYAFDSINYWDQLIGKGVDKVKMTSDEYAAKQRNILKDTVKFNTEFELAQNQIAIAAARGVEARTVTRADAARKALRETDAAYQSLLAQFNMARSTGQPELAAQVKNDLELATIRRNILMNTVKEQKEADVAAAKIRDDARRSEEEKEKKAAERRAKERKSSADKAERERKEKLKKEFDDAKSAIEEEKKIADLQLEASKKSEEEKAVERLRIEEKYLQDLIALRQKYAKKAPDMQFGQGLAVEQTQLGIVQGQIPTAGVDVAIKNLGRQQSALEKAQKTAYQTELEGAQSRNTIRQSEVDATNQSELDKKRLKIESEIAMNNELMAINEKFAAEGSADALNATDTTNKELVAKNKALQQELTAIDKEGNQQRAQNAIAYIDAVSQVFSGAMNLYQQQLSAELSAVQTRYAEETRLAGDNKQKLTEIAEKQREEEKAIKLKQFRANQVAAVADVVFRTAPLIANYLSGVLTAPLATVAIAAQAAQIGFILAQPVPEYRKGTRGKAHPGGPAIVGEEGVERVITESGKVYYTPPTATLIDLPKGAQVVPNKQLKNELFYASLLNRSGNRGTDPVAAGLSELGSIMKGLPIHQVTMDERGFEKYIRTPRRSTRILNNRFPGNV